MKHYFFKNKAYLDVIKEKFQEKRIILGSTDTILGLMGPLEPWAFEQLMTIKKRESKPFVILINNYLQFKMLVDPDCYKRVYESVRGFWPGPLTCIVTLNPLYKQWLFELQKTVAIRMPLHHGLSQIIDECGPLFSTSVNISGFPFAKTIHEVNPLIMEKVLVAILDDSQNDQGLPSTIIDLTNHEPILIRQGLVNVDDFIKSK